MAGGRAPRRCRGSRCRTASGCHGPHTGQHRGLAGQRCGALEGGWPGRRLTRLRSHLGGDGTRLRGQHDEQWPPSRFAFGWRGRPVQLSGLPCRSLSVRRIPLLCAFDAMALMVNHQNGLEMPWLKSCRFLPFRLAAGAA
ncbi:hypothetical protein PAHAL_6G181900 [Panicum hallii]|uniref:Uncharacterized protein n=1 Tax=Panicum hallii TaxID=206008 RepID=A0A2T8IGV2_9POAL|nr:hypothetical protein PAHAL_6G181900 [Panicum hallii]